MALPSRGETGLSVIGGGTKGLFDISGESVKNEDLLSRVFIQTLYQIKLHSFTQVHFTENWCIG